MRVGVYNIEIIQGSDTNDVAIIPTYKKEPISLEGFTARMEIRSEKDSSEVLDELTTENSRIEINSYVENSKTYWRLVLKFPNSTTTAYEFKRGVYDLEVVDSDSKVDRWIEGAVFVNKEVTRE